MADERATCTQALDIPEAANAEKEAIPEEKGHLCDLRRGITVGQEAAVNLNDERFDPKEDEKIDLRREASDFPPLPWSLGSELLEQLDDETETSEDPLAFDPEVVAAGGAPAKTTSSCRPRRILLRRGRQGLVG